MNNFEEAREYFRAFRASKISEYGEAMREYRVGSNTGYAPFPGSDFVVDTIRNIYHSLDEWYADLKTPGTRFITEARLVESWRGSLSQLDTWGEKLDLLRPKINAKGRAGVLNAPDRFEEDDFLPSPYTEARRIHGEVREAVVHTLGIIDRAAAPAALPVDVRLELLFSRFHRVATQLKRRHAGRPTLEISDEYDVQDLMHGLLRLNFDDVRSEEYSPSYAGGNSRIDFVLPGDRIAIEVKMTREGLGDRQVGEQLIIDIARYVNHPEVKTLFCFVYDRGEQILNPDGLISDLEKLGGQVHVRVCIVPRH